MRREMTMGVGVPRSHSGRGSEARRAGGVPGGVARGGRGGCAGAQEIGEGEAERGDVLDVAGGAQRLGQVGAGLAQRQHALVDDRRGQRGGDRAAGRVAHRHLERGLLAGVMARLGRDRHVQRRGAQVHVQVQALALLPGGVAVPAELDQPDGGQSEGALRRAQLGAQPAARIDSHRGRRDRRVAAQERGEQRDARLGPRPGDDDRLARGDDRLAQPHHRRGAEPERLRLLAHVALGADRRDVELPRTRVRRAQ